MEKETLNILMVEDNPGDVLLLKETLRDTSRTDYRISDAGSLADARELLEKNSYQVILLDLHLPDGQGLENIRKLESHAGSAPIIIMTGLDDPNTAVEAVRSGAQDYLVKGKIDADVFWRTVRYSVERKTIDEKLRRARNIAEAGTRAKSEFLAHMSHEIRTPLNVILGISDVLAATELTEEQKGYVKSFRTSGGMLLSLINDLLDLSKIDAGRLEIESIPFDLGELIDNMVEFMSLAAEKRGNRLVCEMATEVPGKIIGDPQRLRQVLFNLIGNAIKFTRDGTVTLQVDVREQQLEFSVRDTGIGIAPERQELIFQDFTQEDSSTSREFGGTGLGLAICRKLVSLWQGHLGVESEKGKGSRFFFTLPLTETDETGFNQREVVSPETLTSLNTLLENYTSEAPLKILVADDSPDNIMLLKAYLKNPCVQIREAENGKKALEQIDLQRPDMLLLDMQMPVMDGYSTVREIRKRESENASPPLPVIALTAYAREQDKRRCLDAGCDRYVSKPVIREQLFFQIASCIKPQVSDSVSQKTGSQEVASTIQVKVDGGLEEIVPGYLERKRTDVQKILQDLKTGEYHSIEVIGHNMLGTGSPYGFHEISRLGKVIELAAIQKDKSTLESKAGELASYLENVQVVYS